MVHGWLAGWLNDDVIKWKHFPFYWPFVRRIHRSPLDSPHKGQWRGALMLSLICAWTNILSQQPRRRRFETPSRSLWRHCSGMEGWIHGVSCWNCVSLIYLIAFKSDPFLCHVHPCAKVMALFLKWENFQNLTFSNFLKIRAFKIEVLVSNYDKFHWNRPKRWAPIDHWTQRPLDFFDFMLEPTMCVTRQNMQ